MTDPETLFRQFFAAKSDHDVDASTAFFHPERTFYADATLGWTWPTPEALRAVWQEYMPAWPPEALSYPTRILGDTAGGAVVFMTDTPELFGGEIRALAPISFADGRIIRWIDYWDGRNFGADKVAAMRTPADSFPDLFSELPVRTPGRIDEAANTLAKSLTADLFAPDATVEDLTSRTTIRGRAAIARWFDRSASSLPWGDGVTVRHVVGGELGGGYEWTSSGEVPRGFVALELNTEGTIDHLTAVWDGSLLPGPALTALAARAVDV